MSKEPGFERAEEPRRTSAVCSLPLVMGPDENPIACVRNATVTHAVELGHGTRTENIDYSLAKCAGRCTRRTSYAVLNPMPFIVARCR